MQRAKLNFNYINDEELSISINEATEINDIDQICEIFESLINKVTKNKILDSKYVSIPEIYLRNKSFLDEKVFDSYHSETSMMRYIKSLERKDLSLNHSMIALGSCTMKLNAAAEMLPLSSASLEQYPSFCTQRTSRRI